MTEIADGVGIESVLEQYADEISRCQYGSFRGLIKDGNVVVFAIEHEWRPQQKRRAASREASLAAPRRNH